MVLAGTGKEWANSGRRVSGLCVEARMHEGGKALYGYYGRRELLDGNTVAATLNSQPLRNWARGGRWMMGYDELNKWVWSILGIFVIVCVIANMILDGRGPKKK